MCEGDILRHIREREHHRIRIMNEVIYFHHRIRGTDREDFDNFSQFLRSESHGTPEFHDFRESNHRIGDERIVHELHGLTSPLFSHVLQVGSHHRENGFSLIEYFFLSSDKYCEFTCNRFWSTSCHGCIEKVNPQSRELSPDTSRPLDTNGRHIDDDRISSESIRSSIDSEEHLMDIFPCRHHRDEDIN